MVWSNTIERICSFGSFKCSYGTFTNTVSTTGGELLTGLSTTVFVKLQPGGGTVIAAGAVVNETLPLGSGAITVKTSAGEDGFWFALGF